MSSFISVSTPASFDFAFLLFVVYKIANHVTANVMSSDTEEMKPRLITYINLSC